MHADLLDRLLVTLAVRLHAFSICKIQQGWRLAFAPFEAVTVHFVLRGTGSLRIEDGSWTGFGINSMIVVPPRQSHAVGAADDCAREAEARDRCALHGDGMVVFEAGDGNPDTLLVCGQISPSYAGALGLFELFQTSIVHTFKPDGVVPRAFDMMLAEVAQPSLGTQGMTEALMKQCLIILLREHLRGDVATSPLLGALREPRLARAVLAIVEQPGGTYSVESLAALAGMSRTSFAARFVEVFQQSPMDFVQRVRLRAAARLLTTTDLPVKVIASSVGYASRSAFSRVFESTYGTPPSDYRSFGGGEEAEPERIETISPDPVEAHLL